MKKQIIKTNLIKETFKLKGKRQILNYVDDIICKSHSDVISNQIKRKSDTKLKAIQYVSVPIYLLPNEEDTTNSMKMKMLCIHIVNVNKLIVDKAYVNKEFGTKYITLKDMVSKFLDIELIESLGFSIEKRTRGKSIVGYLVTPNYDKMREIERQFEIDNDCYNAESWGKYEENLNNMKSKTKNIQHDEITEMMNMANDKGFDIESVEVESVKDVDVVKAELTNTNKFDSVKEDSMTQTIESVEGKSDCEVVKVNDDSSLSIDEFNGLI